MKKVISVAICLVMVLSMIPMTALAVDEIDFTLRIKSETDSDLILTLDYDGGTGFSALDMEISYDRIRLELKSCEKGEGYMRFTDRLSKKGEMSICSINPKDNPIKIGMANITGYEAIDNEKSLIVLKFAKVPGTKFTKEDVKIEFTNCQTGVPADIEVNFKYDLTAPAVNEPDNEGDETTVYPQQTSADNADDFNDSEIGDKVEKTEDGSSETRPDEEEKADSTPSSGKKIIIIVAVVAVCAGVAGAVAFKIKGKKKKQN